MPNEEKENSLKGINAVHPSNRLIYLKLIELRELYRNKSPNICISLTKAISSLRRYPVPITDCREVSKISGLGLKFSRHLHRLFKDKKPIVDEDEIKKHNLNNIRRVCEFMRVNNYFNLLKNKSYKPPTYSNSWTFLCILGLFIDFNQGVKNRLTLDDVRIMFVEFSKVCPKAKLNGFNFLKILAPKHYLNFKIQGQEEIVEDNFSYRYKERYSYGLTEEGRELVESLLSKIEIPLDNIKSTVHKMYQLTYKYNKSDNTSCDDILNGLEQYKFSRSSKPQNIPTPLSQFKTPTSQFRTPLSGIEEIEINSDSDGGMDRENEIYFKSLRERLKIKYGMDSFIDSDYEIITVVDNRELRDSNGKYFTKLTNFYKESRKSIIFRQLPLGDVIWVIKLNSPVFKQCGHIVDELIDHKNCDGDCNNKSKRKGEGKKPRKCKVKKKTPEEIEEEGWFVLDWVLERKTTLDLNSSILDGRYEEQKIRLLNLKGFNKVIYMFEDSPLEQVTNSFAKLGQKALNYKAIQTAKINTRFVSGFNVMNTSNISHSACMLLYLHLNIENFIKENFRMRRLNSEFDLNNFVATNYFSFARFKEENKKRFNMTYFELFGRQMRCIPSVGEQLTCSILSLWPTPYLFYEAINNLSLEELNKALAQANRRSRMSRQVYEVCRDLFMSSKGASSHSEAYFDILDVLRSE